MKYFTTKGTEKINDKDMEFESSAHNYFGSWISKMNEESPCYYFIGGKIENKKCRFDNQCRTC